MTVKKVTIKLNDYMHKINNDILKVKTPDFDFTVNLKNLPHIIENDIITIKPDSWLQYENLSSYVYHKCVKCGAKLTESTPLGWRRQGLCGLRCYSKINQPLEFN